MDFKNVLAGIMTADSKSAQLWYSNLFDRTYDYNPMHTLYEWDFHDGGVLQLFEDKERAGKSSITLMVSDIEELVESLDKKNITHEKITEGSVAKTLIIYDPEKNRIAFAENKQGR